MSPTSTAPAAFTAFASDEPFSFAKLLASGSGFRAGTSVADVLTLLGHSFSLDPAAMIVLFNNRVPVSEDFAEESAFLVEPVPFIGAEQHALGTLGVVNGLLLSLTGYRVAMRFGPPAEEGGIPTALGFQIHVPHEIGDTYADSSLPWKEQSVRECQIAYQWLALYNPYEGVDTTGPMERLEELIGADEFDGKRYDPEDRLWKFVYDETTAFFDGYDDDTPDARGVYAATVGRAAIDRLGETIEAWREAQEEAEDLCPDCRAKEDDSFKALGETEGKEGASDA